MPWSWPNRRRCDCPTLVSESGSAPKPTGAVRPKAEVHDRLLREGGLTPIRIETRDGPTIATHCTTSEDGILFANPSGVLDGQKMANPALIYD
jgi:hypothetical protein